MAGNVAEWVADVYRPIIDNESNDFNYFRETDILKIRLVQMVKWKLSL
jgi:formylglycine-generating enzyme required for sulfatase activity